MLYYIVKILLKFMLRLFFKVKVKGEENIPKDIGLIVCSNHYHWLDPVVVACFFNRKISFMAKKELFDNKFFAFLLKKIYAFPVNRQAADISAIKNALKTVKSNKVLGMFPEGTRVKGNEFGEAKAGLALFAIKGKANVVPISIITNYKIFSKVTIYIDKPISFEEYYKQKLSTEDYERLSQDVLEVIKDNYYKR